jgi:preprotein translocase subunit SecF
MEFFKTNTKIPFMKQRYIAAVFSAIIFLGSIAALAINGLNLGLDFTGGTQAEVVFTTPQDSGTLVQDLRKAGFPKAQVQAYSGTDFSVRIAPQKTAISQEALKAKILKALPGAKLGGSLEYLGPQVSKTLLTNGILAILVSLIATMVYIAFRFEYRFAVSSAIALIHDPILILGVFAFFHMEFNMIVLTAVLTVIGYSLNDTIVVYDRVRENFRKVRKGSPTEIMDLSINQTLSRTIMTSGLTLVVVIALFLFGGPVVHGFSLALIIGIVIGTYSSIYVAGSLAVAFGLNRTHLLPAPKVAEDSMP